MRALSCDRLPPCLLRSSHSNEHRFRGQQQSVCERGRAIRLLFRRFNQTNENSDLKVKGSKLVGSGHGQVAAFGPLGLVGNAQSETIRTAEIATSRQSESCDKQKRPMLCKLASRLINEQSRSRADDPVGRISSAGDSLIPSLK